jgi:hypothetical protein
MLIPFNDLPLNLQCFPVKGIVMSSKKIKIQKMLDALNLLLKDRY